MKRLVKPYGRLLVPVVVILAFVVAAVLLVPPIASQTTTEGSTATAPPKIEARKNVLDGRDVGEVWINGKVVIRLQRSAGGYTSYERAEKVAERLKSLVDSGADPAALKAGYSSGYPAVLWGDELIITADRFHANLNAATPVNLAKTWANQIRSALTEAKQPGETGEPGRAGPVEPPEEEYGDKWVPIISAGDGIHIGAARVNGPKTNLGQVQGVAMIELNWDKLATVKIRVYVPISTKVPGKTLARVQRCSVSAVGDFRL